LYILLNLVPWDSKVIRRLPNDVVPNSGETINQISSAIRNSTGRIWPAPYVVEDDRYPVIGILVAGWPICDLVCVFSEAHCVKIGDLDEQRTPL
jgi:hypothetical protein